MYKHGAYGELTASKVKSASTVDTAAVYIGTAPVNLISGYKDKKLINKPVKVSNYNDAVNKFGYSDDWKKFSLCEVIAAHFNNKIENVGPIYLINVLDPAVHKKAEATTADVVFTDGRGEIESDTAVVDTVAVAEKTKDVDYKVFYDFKTGKVIIDSVGKAKLSGSLSVSYDETDISAVTKDTVIGEKSADGGYSGIQAADLLYTQENIVASLIASPGWSEVPEVYKALCSKASDINGHFKAFVIADIPLTDTSGAVDTIDKAVAWKASNGYNSEFSKVCWPGAIDSDNKTYHLSTLCTVTMQRVDASNDGIPFESPSNKEISVTGQYFGADAANMGFDQNDANKLNEKGITTAIFWNGLWKLWGPHTAAYTYNADIDARSVFDSTVRMLLFVTNGFQIRNADKIDEPMNINIRDTIIASEQQLLDSYAGRGALIGNPEIRFEAASNTLEDIKKGDFVFDFDMTVSTPLKSGIAKVSYTDEGFSSYFGGEVNE